METRRYSIARPTRSHRRTGPALLVLLVLAAAPSLARAGPIRDRAQAVAARDAAQRALLGRDAGTLRADAVSARSQAFQLRRESILDSEAFRRQEAFYARALEQGMARVPRPQFLEYLLVPDVTGLLPESSTIDYLRWRRSLNPSRFDRNHPWIGPILERDRIAQNQQPIPLPPVIPPVDPEVPIIPPAEPQEPPGPIGGGGRPSPQVPVPEPGSMALWAALGIGGAFALARRRRVAP